MSEKIVQPNEEVIKGQPKELVRGSVEETLNGLLEAEAEKLTQAGRYERSEQRQGYRSGHYNRNLMTTAGEVIFHIQSLNQLISFGSLSKSSMPPDPYLSRIVCKPVRSSFSCCTVKLAKGARTYPNSYPPH